MPSIREDRKGTARMPKARQDGVQQVLCMIKTSGQSDFVPIGGGPKDMRARGI